MNSLSTMLADYNGFLADFREDEVVRIARDLLAIQSHRFAPGHETPAARHIYDLLQAEGIECSLREVRDGRMNVIAALRGTGSGPRVMFNGHTDTVPPGEMARPFDPHIVGDRLYARGACDMKGGIASQLYAMIMIKRAGIRLAGDLIFTGVIAEEDSTSLGSLDIVAHGPRADMVVVAEPSDLQVIVAHKGFDYYRIEVRGCSAHSSAPQNGVSAAYAAARIVTDIEERLIRFAEKRVHPLLQSASLNVGALIGYAENEAGTALRQGHQANIKPPGGTVPDVCNIYLDRRRIPGETLDLVKSEIDGWLTELAPRIPGAKAELHFTPACPELPSHPPLDTDPDHPFVQSALSLNRAIAGIDGGATGVPFWSDAALFNEGWGVPAIVYGPGSISVAHSNNEFVPVNELLKAARVNAALALSLVGENA
jgi:acetylornithine deacetylase/succinyl-diaminopimelate desuccinylase family protein